jgi:hypothetical protein
MHARRRGDMVRHQCQAKAGAGAVEAAPQGSNEASAKVIPLKLPASIPRQPVIMPGAQDFVQQGCMAPRHLAEIGSRQAHQIERMK